MSTQNDLRCSRFDVEALESRQLLSAPAEYNLGLGGKIATHSGKNGIFEPWDSIAQPDGKMVLVGFGANRWGSSVIRFKRDGSVDRSLGEDGQVLLPLGGAYEVKLQRNGKLLVRGNDGIARLKPDGWSDHSFGRFGFLHEPHLGR